MSASTTPARSSTQPLRRTAASERRARKTAAVPYGGAQVAGGGCKPRTVTEQNRTEKVEDKTHIPGGTHTESPTAPYSAPSTLSSRCRVAPFSYHSRKSVRRVKTYASRGSEGTGFTQAGDKTGPVSRTLVNCICGNIKYAILITSYSSNSFFARRRWSHGNTPVIRLHARRTRHACPERHRV